MKKVFTVFIFLTIINLGNIFPQGVWTQKVDFGGVSRMYAVSFSIGNKIYIGTGIDNANNLYNDFWEYDIINNTWTQKTNFGGPARWSAVGFSIGSKGYIGVGRGTGSTYFNDFWEYDPSNDTWTQKANFGGGARMYATGFSIGTKGYIGTGWNGSSMYNDFWEWDQSNNTWTQKANFGGSQRQGAVGFSINSKGYIGTGTDNSFARKKDFWEYNPNTNQWTQKFDFGGSARDQSVGFSIGNKGYILAGKDGSSINQKDFWEFDPNTNTWLQKADFDGTARYGLVGTSNGTNGYIGTGNDGLYKKDFWEFSQCTQDTILIQDTVVHISSPVTMPIINTNTLQSSCNIISYQFDLAYDPAKLQYVNNNLTGTIAAGGTVLVNSSTAGLLHVSYMTSTPLGGAGSILNLEFNPLTIGTSPLTITNFLYNTDTITTITNGSITAIGLYGDIDTNGYVQAYDAALALQYSVGLDPLPNSDPLPWENWRMIIANVDGVGSVTANDASLILQHSAGLITLFPVESVKSSENPVADVTITQDNSELVFTSTGELYGLNINANNGNQVIMNTPSFLVSNMMSATNINGSTYNIGLCTAYSPSDNTEIMRIPFTCSAPETLTFNMIINKTVVTKTFAVSCTVGMNEGHQQSVNIFPNPANDRVEITGLDKGQIQILNALGQVIYTSEIINTSTSIDVSKFLSGIYTISIKTNNDTITQKLIIK